MHNGPAARGVQGIVGQALELFSALAQGRRTAKLLEGGLEPLLHLCIGARCSPTNPIDLRHN